MKTQVCSGGALSKKRHPHFSGSFKGRTTGVQNRRPQAVPLWRMSYFELSATVTLQVHEKLVSLPERILIRGLARNKSYQNNVLWPMNRAGQISNY